MLGKKRPEMTGSKNQNWLGGNPSCKECNKKLSIRNGKTGLCHKCFQKYSCLFYGQKWTTGIKLSKKQD